MVRKIITILLISLIYSCTATKPVVEEEKPKMKKYRIVVHKTDGTIIKSKIQ